MSKRHRSYGRSRDSEVEFLSLCIEGALCHEDLSVVSGPGYSVRCQWRQSVAVLRECQLHATARFSEKLTAHIGVTVRAPPWHVECETPRGSELEILANNEMSAVCGAYCFKLVAHTFNECGDPLTGRSAPFGRYGPLFGITVADEIIPVSAVRIGGMVMGIVTVIVA